METRSLGLVEICGYVAAIEAADAGCKAANVSLLGYERGRAGLLTVKFAGDVAAVRAAVAAASVAAGRVGKVVAVHVIARPDRQLGVLSEGEKPQPLGAVELMPLTAGVAKAKVDPKTYVHAEVTQLTEPTRQERVEEQAAVPEAAEHEVLALPSAAEDITSTVVEPAKRVAPEPGNAPHSGPSSKSRRNANTQKNKGKKKF